MTRSFSLSIDPGRRWSVASNNFELNGFGGQPPGTGFNCTGHRHSSIETPLIKNGVGGLDSDKTSPVSSTGQYLAPDSYLARANGQTTTYLTVTDAVNRSPKRVKVTVPGRDLCPQTGV